MVSNDHTGIGRLMGRNYVADVKPFAQSQRPDENGVVRTYRYPTEGENPTPFYENLRATLPGVSSVLKTCAFADEQDLSAFRDLPFLDDAPEIPWGCESLTTLIRADLTSRSGTPVSPVLRRQVRS